MGNIKGKLSKAVLKTTKMVTKATPITMALFASALYLNGFSHLYTNPKDAFAKAGLAILMSVLSYGADKLGKKLYEKLSNKVKNLEKTHPEWFEKNLEIERKFLVNEEQLNSILNIEHISSEIEQYYTALDKKEVRFRRVKTGDDVKYFKTTKIRSNNPLVRKEIEESIPKVVYCINMSKIKGNKIEKTRHIVQACGTEMEVDVYKGNFKGLIVAEKEFKSVEDAQNFTPPTYCAQEITYNEEYNNKNLAMNMLPFNRTQEESIEL